MGPCSYTSFCLFVSRANSISLEVENIRDFSFLTIDIGLTEQGIKHPNAVVQMLYRYVHLVQKEGLSRRMWNDKWEMAKLAFRFQENSETASFVSEVSARMQTYEPGNLLGSPHNYDFNDALLNDVFSCIQPEKMLMFILSDSHDTPLGLTEPVYGTQYSVETISSAVLRSFGEAQAPRTDGQSSMSLPGNNPFMPESFALYQPRDPQIGTKLVKIETGIKVWHQPSAYFDQPKLVFSCIVEYPDIRYNMTAVMLLELYAELLNDVLEAPTYQAREVGMSGTYSASGSTFHISVMGHSNPSDRLLMVLLMATKRTLMEARFDVIKDLIKQSISNEKFENTYLYTWKSLWPWMFRKPGSLPEEKLALLETITFEHLVTFASSLRHQPNHIECLAFGNLKASQAETMAERIQGMLQLHPVDQVHAADSVLLPMGLDTAIQLPGPSPDDTNSVLLSTYQYPADTSLVESLKLELIQTITDQAAYNQLRTQEQLGYVVFTTARTSHTQRYNLTTYSVLIQSGVKDPGYLDERVEAFLKTAYATLQAITPEALWDSKVSFYQQKWPVPVTLKDEFSTRWVEVSAHTYDFLRPYSESDALMEITKEDLLRVSPAFLPIPIPLP